MLAIDQQHAASLRCPAEENTSLPDEGHVREPGMNDRDSKEGASSGPVACRGQDDLTTQAESPELTVETSNCLQSDAHEAVQSSSDVSSSPSIAHVTGRTAATPGMERTSATMTDGQDENRLRALLHDKEEQIDALKQALEQVTQKLSDLQGELEKSHIKHAELQCKLEEYQRQSSAQKHAANSPTSSQSVTEGSTPQIPRLHSDEVERMQARLVKAEKALEAERKMVTMLQRKLSSQHVPRPQTTAVSGSRSPSRTQSENDASSQPASTAAGTFEERLKLGGMSMEAALQQHRADQLALQHVRQEKVSLSASLKTAVAEVERLQAQVRAAEDRARTADGVALDAVKSKSAMAAALDKLVADNNQLTDHTNEQARRIADLQANLEEKEREVLHLRSQLKRGGAAASPAPVRLAASIPCSPHTSAPSSPLKSVAPAAPYHTTPHQHPSSTPKSNTPQLAALASNAQDYLLVLAAEMRRLAEILEDEHGASSAPQAVDSAAMTTSKACASSTFSSMADGAHERGLSPAVVSVITPAALEALKLMQSIAAINPSWAISTALDGNIDDTLLQLMVLKDEVEELATQVACLLANPHSSSTSASSASACAASQVADHCLHNPPASSGSSSDNTSSTVHSTQSNASNHASSSGTGAITHQLQGPPAAGSGQPSTHASPPVPPVSSSQQSVTSSSACETANLEWPGSDILIDGAGTSKPLGILTVPQDATAASSSRPSPIVPLISPKDRYGIPYAAPVDKEALEALQALSPVAQCTEGDNMTEGEAGYVPIKLTAARAAVHLDESKLAMLQPTESDAGTHALLTDLRVPGSQAEAAGKLSWPHDINRQPPGSFTAAGHEPSAAGAMVSEFDHDEAQDYVNVSNSPASMMAVPVTEAMESRGSDGDVQPLAAKDSPRAQAGLTTRQRSSGFWGWLVGSAA